ncbi:MAG TPA: hypothetical protein VNZ58_00205 [Thermomicrobiales bacterium]|nr:hypothetical protein [Thermomicrobiales bacterium]
MTRLHARQILLVDAIGCGVAALMISLLPPTWRATDLPARWRRPFAGTLGAFAALLGIASSRHCVESAHLRIAAIGNLGWVAGCLGSLRVVRSGRGRGFLIATALMDGIMAVLQWRAASR